MTASEKKYVKNLFILLHAEIDDLKIQVARLKGENVDDAKRYNTILKGTVDALLKEIKEE